MSDNERPSGIGPWLRAKLGERFNSEAIYKETAIKRYEIFKREQAIAEQR
jgi:hypothetical protein